MRRPWTIAEQNQLIKMRKSGVKVDVIAKRLQRTSAAIRDCLRRLGVVIEPEKRSVRKRGTLKAVVSRMLRDGKSVRDCSEILGVYPSVISRIRSTCGIPATPTSEARKRSWEWRRKCDPEQVREYDEAGWTAAEIADEMNCSISTVKAARVQYRRKNNAV